MKGKESEASRPARAQTRIWKVREGGHEREREKVVCHSDVDERDDPEAVARWQRTMIRKLFISMHYVCAVARQ
jgi:hypothetical protein